MYAFISVSMSEPISISISIYIYIYIYIYIQSGSLLRNLLLRNSESTRQISYHFFLDTNPKIHVFKVFKIWSKFIQKSMPANLANPIEFWITQTVSYKINWILGNPYALFGIFSNSSDFMRIATNSCEFKRILKNQIEFKQNLMFLAELVIKSHCSYMIKKYWKLSNSSTLTNSCEFKLNICFCT